VQISQESIEFIISWEVAGGDATRSRPEYERKYNHPTWPGNSASGLTIGIGYDLRFARKWFEADWKTRLERLPAPKDAYNRLAGYVGRGGTRAAERATRDISIPWEDAIAVFTVRRLPHYLEETELAFPGVEGMTLGVRGALVSVVYNCGSGTSRPSQLLKRQAYESIRAAVRERNALGVAAGIRALKAYHDRDPSVAKGLDRRREAEARLVERAPQEAAA
jgi:hypothetical protein